MEMAEGLIRRGVSLLFSKRLATLSSNYLKGLVETKARTHCLLLDANNPYGGFRQKSPLFPANLKS